MRNCPRAKASVRIYQSARMLENLLLPNLHRLLRASSALGAGGRDLYVNVFIPGNALPSCLHSCLVGVPEYGQFSSWPSEPAKDSKVALCSMAFKMY